MSNVRAHILHRLYFAVLCFISCLAAHAGTPPPESAFTFETCQPIPFYESGPEGGDSALSPNAVAINGLWKFDQKFKRHSNKDREVLHRLNLAATVTVLTEPKQGKLTATALLFPVPSPNLIFYAPESARVRGDRVVFLVKMENYSIKVISTLQSFDGRHNTSEGMERILCGKRGTDVNMINGE